MNKSNKGSEKEKAGEFLGINPADRGIAAVNQR